MLLWTTDDALTHAAFSAHGKVPPVAKDALHLGNNGRVRAVYHKHNVRTHALRGAKEGESAENARGWLTPPLVEWDRLSASLQAKLEGHDFGAAHCPFTNGRFPVELAKSPPPGYPGGDAWAQALR